MKEEGNVFQETWNEIKQYPKTIILVILSIVTDAHSTSLAIFNPSIHELNPIVKSLKPFVSEQTLSLSLYILPLPKIALLLVGLVWLKKNMFPELVVKGKIFWSLTAIGIGKLIASINNYNIYLITEEIIFNTTIQKFLIDYSVYLSYGSLIVIIFIGFYTDYRREKNKPKLFNKHNLDI